MRGFFSRDLLAGGGGGSVRLGYSRNPTQCVNVLVLRLVAGLLRPRPSFKQVEQSSKKRKVSVSATMLNLTTLDLENLATVSL